MWRSRLVVGVNVANRHKSIVPAWLDTVLLDWIRVGGSDRVGVTGNTRVKWLLKKATPTRILPAILAYSGALPDAPASQNGSWILSPPGKSLAVLSVVGLAVCCQPWIFCGDWDHFCYHNGTHNENVVCFSVLYGSVDHLPWPYRH